MLKKIVLVSDEGVPTGKKLEVSCALQSKSAMKVKARFFGRAEGGFMPKTNAFSIANTDVLTNLKPAILFDITDGAPVRLELPKKGKQQNFILTTSEVSITSNEVTPLLTFVIVGTTIESSQYVSKQIENTYQYLKTKKAEPRIVVETVPDKQKISPGDTMTYTIYYHNIGAADAKDVTVAVPIPQGTKYIENSAEGIETTITLTRKEAKAPPIGDVTSVNWNDNSILKSGEGKLVRYRVVVQ